MSHVLKSLAENSNLKLHFPNAKIISAIPYVTRQALNLLQSVGVEVIYHHLMPRFGEDEAFDFEGGEFVGATATYFQHKIAAGGHSTVPLVECGLVEEIIPPYKNL